MSNTHRCCNPGFRSSRLSQAIQGILLASALTASVAAHGEQTTNRKSYRISGGSLGQALSQFARDAGILFTGESTLTDGKTSKGLEGEYTVEEGFRKLLSGSGLTYTIMDDNAVAIKIADSESNAASTLPAVKVLGKAGYDATDPYNPDYRRSNASTATKTDTPIMETPFSVKVVPQQVLKDQQAVRIDKALQNVSSVQAFPFNQQQTDEFLLRGFPTTSYYRDGFRFEAGNTFYKRDTANLESIEVLKGPGSILYGRSEPGGIINLVTKQPRKDPYYAFQQQFGSYDFYRSTLDATGSVSKDNSVLYRMNAAYENGGGFKEFMDNERVFVAPVLRWDVSDRTQINLELEYLHNNNSSDPGVPVSGNRPVSLPRERNLGEPFGKTKADSVLAGINWSHAFNDNWKIRHRFNTIVADEDRKGIFVATEPDLNGNVLRGMFDSGNEQQIYYNTVDLTGKLNIAGLQHELLMGGDYYRLDNKLSPSFLILPGTFNIYNPVHLLDINQVPSRSRFTLDSTTSWFGLYFQDQIKLPFNLHAMGGLRYDNAIQNDNIAHTIGQEEDRVSPRGGLLWRPIPELSVYGSYTENFGASNGRKDETTFLPPETAQQWELGTKTEFGDGRFTGSVAYFDLTKQNRAIPLPNTIFSRAIGESKTRGVELDLSGEIVPGWRMIAAYTFMPFAKITKDNDDQGNPANTNNRLFQVPRHSGSLWNTYEFVEGELNGLKLGAGVVAADQRQGNAENTYKMPGYTTVNMLASYAIKAGGSKITIQLNVDNLLDKTYFAGSNTANSVYVGTPRTFMGSVRVEY